MHYRFVFITKMPCHTKMLLTGKNVAILEQLHKGHEKKKSHYSPDITSGSMHKNGRASAKYTFFTLFEPEKKTRKTKYFIPPGPDFTRQPFFTAQTKFTRIL